MDNPPARRFPTDDEIDAWIAEQEYPIPNRAAERDKHRAVARTLLAAESIAFRALCEHTDEPTAQIEVICDPPAQVCLSCWPDVEPTIAILGMQWPDQCDRCGAPAGTGPRPYTSCLEMGRFLVLSKICETCFDDELTFTRPARTRPCPCGSGEKYKRCCAPRA